ncbi:unnamed protein product [Spirodela intermedia]|uniref:Inositol polyphosphate-related phosphatase domain-containing protein n=1 Tax=Spirodela intermedia TaxID=51605 RepID=A0A7I8KN03_SPIIN|nr:unnamed protein product [Spirodela intermedia]
MSDESSTRRKPPWSKCLVRKWFNIKSKGQLFQDVDDSISKGGDGEWRSSSFSERETWRVKKTRREGSSRQNPSLVRGKRFDPEPPRVSGVLDYRIFVSTWNVGGICPPSRLNLDDWLLSSPFADIYVLGFQEIVPLNAGNVLGAENNAPAKKWVSLIRKTLNSPPRTGSNRSYDPSVVDPDEDSGSSSSRRRALLFPDSHSFRSSSNSFRTDSGLSLSGRSALGGITGEYDFHCGWCGSDVGDDEENPRGDSSGALICSPSSDLRCISSSMEREREEGKLGGSSRYLLVARKQMVGIFLTVWVRTEMKDDVRNLRVSCVGRGLMGRLGNKGSISISMSLHQTSFCFVCCHLTSGQREGDELRRNSDVMEILRRSRFPPVDDLAGEGRLPETILDHSRIIWLGDLNYRVALSHNAARSLAQARDWSSLLENDQLHKEQRFRRVFEGWKEGKISFPPTYKYSANSDRFSGDDLKVREKRRTPAWCDRILWYGSGLSQLSYLRGDSKLSDHRPVFGVFSAEVELVCCGSPTKSMACSGSRIEVEELLP